jgi:hypothetical protein
MTDPARASLDEVLQPERGQPASGTAPGYGNGPAVIPPGRLLAYDHGVTRRNVQG